MSLTKATYSMIEGAPVNVLDYGAVGDGVTDDTAALNAMAAAVGALYDAATNVLNVRYLPQVYFPPSEGFITTTGISLPAGVTLTMESPLLIQAAANAAVVGITLTDPRNLYAQSPRMNQSVLWVERLTQSDWSSESDIGVYIPSTYASRIYIKKVSGFCKAFDVCMGYGELRLDDIRGAKISDIAPRTTNTQFTNHLRVQGGFFSSSVNAGISRYGIRVKPPTTLGPNSITFDGQSFELDLTLATTGNPSGEAIPFILDASAASANINSIRGMNLRSETNSLTVVRAIGDVRNTDFSFIDAENEYTHPTCQMLDDQTTGGGNNRVYRNATPSAGIWNEIFNTGQLNRQAVSRGGPFLSVVNMEFAENVSPATFNFHANGPSFNASGFLTATSALCGVRVELNGERSLAVKGSKASGDIANLNILCFDSSGTQLSTAGLVKYEQYTATVNAGAFGGVYAVGATQATTNTEFEVIMNFASNVTRVFVSVEKSQGWQLYSPQGRATWFSRTSHLAGRFVASAIPVALANVTYVVGMEVYFITAGPSDFQKWVCTDATTPTFKTCSLISA